MHVICFPSSPYFLSSFLVYPFNFCNSRLSICFTSTGLVLHQRIQQVRNRQLVQGCEFGSHSSPAYVILSAHLWIKWRSPIITCNLRGVMQPLLTQAPIKAHLGWGSLSWAHTLYLLAFLFPVDGLWRQRQQSLFLAHSFPFWPTLLEHGSYMFVFLTLWINITTCISYAGACT